MPFWENLKIFASQKTYQVAKMTGDLAQQAKLKYAVYDVQNELNKLFSQIGQMVYERHENGELFDGEIVSKCEEIERKNSIVADLMGKINDIRNSSSS